MNMQKKEIKEYKKKLKQEKKYKEYKKIFKNKKYRFIFFEYGNIFGIKDQKTLETLENSLFTSTSEKHFQEKFYEFGNSVDKQFKELKWKEFGSFVYYVFHYSNFYFEKKNSIYKKDNLISLNKIKKEHYYNWLDSFYEKNIINFNDYVLKVINFSI